MSDGYPESMKGHFILAMPGLPDPNFAETVTCICEHNETGALGFIVNKLHPLLTGRELFEDLGIECDSSVDRLNVYLGGPVQPSGVFVLHGPPFDWSECLRITDGLGLSNSRDILDAVARNEGPESFLVLLGCAGWGPMQLDSELKENAWLTCAISEEIVFHDDVDLKWEKAMMMVGGH
ncbi:MAG: YqgE/AlgH family protein [Desulfobacteraceae bacterium]